jgi:hypothetical protein
MLEATAVLSYSRTGLMFGRGLRHALDPQLHRGDRRPHKRSAAKRLV